MKSSKKRLHNKSRTGLATCNYRSPGSPGAPEKSHFRKMPAHTDSTILDSRKRKRRPEGHKIDELYKFSNDSTMIKYFERSTVERIEENSNGLSRCLFPVIRYTHNTAKGK